MSMRQLNSDCGCSRRDMADRWKPKRASILSEAVAGDREQPEPNLAEAIRRRFAPLGGVDLELPPAEFVDAPPSFDP